MAKARQNAEDELLDFLYGDQILNNLACTLNTLYWDNQLDPELERWFKSNYNPVSVDTFCMGTPEAPTNFDYKVPG